MAKITWLKMGPYPVAHIPVIYPYTIYKGVPPPSPCQMRVPHTVHQDAHQLLGDIVPLIWILITYIRRNVWSWVRRIQYFRLEIKKLNFYCTYPRFSSISSSLSSPVILQNISQMHSEAFNTLTGIWLFSLEIYMLILSVRSDQAKSQSDWHIK